MKFRGHSINLIFFFIFFSINAQDFKVNEQEISINTKDIFKPASRIQMINSLQFNNEFYSIFEESEMYYMGHSQKYLIKFDRFGKILLAIVLPKKLSQGYYIDFFEANNKIYIQEYNNSSYIFDSKKEEFIEETKKGKDLVFENGIYKVMYKSFGEWGQATWFINKKDKSEYFTSLNGQDVNFLNNKFYITNMSSIWEIANPKNLNKCEPNQLYDSINNKKFGMFNSYDFFKGTKCIFKDTVEYNEYEPKSIENLNFIFLTSFVTNNYLYQITQLKDKTAITEINNDKLEITFPLKKKYDFFSWHNQYRNNKNNYKFLKFKNGYNSFGFFEVEDKKIDITKVHFEYDTLQYVKSDNIVNLISNLSSKRTITKKDILEFEKSTSGTDLQKYRNNINHNGYFPQKFKNIEVQTINFLKSENEILTQNIDYLYTKNDEEIKAIYVDYDKTNYFNTVGKNYLPIRNNNTDLSDEKFKNKYAEIREQLNKSSQQIKVKPRPNKGTFESWIINGWRFNLYKIKTKDIYGVTLLICKEEDFNEND